MTMTLYIDNTMLLEALAVRDLSQEGQPLITEADSALALILYPGTGALRWEEALADTSNHLTGQSWPVTLSHIGDGDWQSVLSHEIVVSDQTRLQGWIRIVKDGNRVTTWAPPVFATRRTE